MKNRKIGINKSREIFYDDEFLDNINTLFDSIKEINEVSKNISNNKNILIDLIEEEINKSNSFLEKILKEINYNKLDLLTDYFENIKFIFNKFKLQTISEDKNLFLFYEDVKIVYNKLKQKRKESLLNNNSNRNLNNQALNAFNNNHKNISIKNLTENYNTLNMENNDIKYNKYSTIDNNITSSNIRSQYFKKIFDEYEKQNQTNENNINSSEYNPIFVNKKNSVISHNIENKNVKTRNKKIFSKENTLENTFKKLTNSQIDSKEEIKSFLKENNNNNIYKKQNELIKIINIYKKEFEKLKKENNKLKQYILSINKDDNNIINIKECEQTLGKKLNSFSKDNIVFKKNMEKIKPKLPISKNNSKSKLQKKNNIFFNENNYSQPNINENEFLKKKIYIIEKNLMLKQNKIDELNNEISLLNSMYQLDIMQISGKNPEIQNNSKKGEKASLSSKNIIINKESKNIKKSSNKKALYDIDYNYNYNINENSSNIFKKIENYKKENGKIKNQNIYFKDKIENYQMEIEKMESELIGKKCSNTKLKNNIQNIIKEIKEKYEKKISEINIKNKSIEKLYIKNNNDLYKQISCLNKQIVHKNAKILELNAQIKKLNESIKNKEEEYNKLLIKNEIISKNDKKELKEKLERQEILNRELNEILLDINNNNELLKNKIICNEKKISEMNNIIKNNDKLHNEIKNLKNENIILKSNNEKLQIQLKNVLDNANINNNDEKIKKQNEEIEGLKQIIYKIQKEREKYDDKINLLKKEKEIIQNKLNHFSQKNNEEYNDLQKQCKDIENKYNQKINNKMLEDENKGLNEKQLSKELKEAKKEIEIIKKKNSQLVE